MTVEGRNSCHAIAYYFEEITQKVKETCFETNFNRSVYRFSTHVERLLLSCGA